MTLWDLKTRIDRLIADGKSIDTMVVISVGEDQSSRIVGEVDQVVWWALPSQAGQIVVMTRED